jgi:hypothetical protein
MKITKRQLRRIIREEKSRLLKEQADMRNLAELGDEIYSALEDVIMGNLPAGVDFLNTEEFAAFEKSVMDGLNQMRDRIVRNFSGEIVSREKFER